ncbi:MAG: HNH endonuclease signature motif containing protein [Sulfurovaceae bacterium]|nr:HNH endonuclease signature motif containing protein [Sulfurovaceae bacterium]
MKRLCPIHGIYAEDRCPKCNKQTAKTYDKTKRKNSNFYHSKQWKEVRDIQLKRNPICCVEGCDKPAVIVDHIIEIEDGGCKLCLDNLQSMCISCHNIKTKETAAARGGRSKSLQNSSTNTDAPSRFLQSPFHGGTL